MDTHMDSPTWTTTAPTAPGLYHFACDETDDAWELVRVDTWLSLRRRHGTPWTGEHIGMRAGLYVDCPHLGVLPLPEYHDGLTSPRWRLVDPLTVDQMDAEEGTVEHAPFGWGTIIAGVTAAYPNVEEGDAWWP